MASSSTTDPNAPVVETDTPNVRWVRSLKATARSADGDVMLREYDALRKRYDALVRAVRSARERVEADTSDSQWWVSRLVDDIEAAIEGDTK